MVAKYETEREEKTDLLGKLTAQLQERKQSEYDINQWVELIKEYMHVEVLDRELLLKLIDKIVVGEKQEENGEIVRDITIFYNYIGAIA